MRSLCHQVYSSHNLYELANDCQRMGACSTILDFIDSIPEEHNEDLEEAAQEYSFNIPTQLEANSVWKKETEQHFKDGAKWQKQKDEELFSEDTWNYIEENYPNITKEEKLRLYDVSIKSRLAGANTIKQHMKEALQTEYEKGRFDMREEMMKDAIDGNYWIGEIHLDIPIIQGYDDGDRIKFIPIKDKQQ